MAILKTRFERATDMPLRANAFVRGGRLVKINAVGDHPHKPKVIETAASADHAIGAAATDALAGQDVTVTMTRGLMLLQTTGAVEFNVDVYPADGGRVQAIGTPAAADRSFGRSFSRATAADQLIWVKPYR